MRLSERLSWREYCVGRKIPVSIVSVVELREYVCLLHVMRKQWLEYKPFADMRLQEWFLFSGRYPGKVMGAARCCTDISHVAEHNVMHARACLRSLSDPLRGLIAVVGALAIDYVSAMEVAWSPDVALRLGDVELIFRLVRLFLR